MADEAERSWLFRAGVIRFLWERLICLSPADEGAWDSPVGNAPGYSKAALDEPLLWQLGRGDDPFQKLCGCLVVHQKVFPVSDLFRRQPERRAPHLADER